MYDSFTRITRTAALTGDAAKPINIATRANSLVDGLTVPRVLSLSPHRLVTRSHLGLARILWQRAKGAPPATSASGLLRSLQQVHTDRVEQVVSRTKNV